MNSERDINLLINVQLFDSLTTEELQNVRNKIVIKKFKKNQVMLYEEDANKYMYAILDGSVKVMKTTEDGKEIVLAMHKKGDSFGEISLVDGRTTTASVLATDDCLVAIISKEDFFSLLYSQKKVLHNVLKMLCSRIRENVDKIEILNFNHASQRIKMALAKLSQEHGEKTPDGIILHMRLTHQDIANMTGLTRETVTRVIDVWQKNGDITILKNKSILLGPDFMEET